MLVFAPDVLLVIFTGLLFGVFFGGSADWLSRRLGINRTLGVFLVIVAIIGALVAFGFWFAPVVADQFDQLSRLVPEAIGDLRERLSQYAWGETLVARATPSALLTGEGGATAAGAVTTTFGAMGNFVIMLFVGLYVALAPVIYRKGVICILAPSLRNDGREVLTKMVNTLKSWLLAQLFAMSVVGVLTWLGLWLVGVPLAPVLGLIAALLAFIPNIGPILAAVPGVLLAFSEGTTTALLALGVYVAVQSLESYVITPLIQQEQVSLPPALIISVQLLMGTLFGILGLALATPLAAIALTLVRETYVERYLEQERARDAGVAGQ
jgi:predicted PurR-regulated permease PerM